MRSTNLALLFIALIIALSASPADAFEPWADPLPIPSRIVVSAVEKELTLRMNEFSGKVHRDFPETRQWGYEGTSPGPTIEVESGQALTIHWKNELPESHFLSKPAGMEEPNLPDVRAVVHLHGAAVEQSSITDRLHNNDGWPDLWIRPGEEQIANYPNAQSSRMLWYHDHAIGTTGRNVAAGLIGAYIIRDELERSLNLPYGKYEIPLILQPKKLRGDGSIDYVETLARENQGNAFFVNGRMYPYLEVEPRKYRFRILNGSNARTVALKLVEKNDLSASGPAFHQIGSDSGFLENPVTLNDPSAPNAPRLSLMPAERADVIIDFSKFVGKELILHNNQLAEDPDGIVPLRQLMLFKVGEKAIDPDTSSIPGAMRKIERLEPASAARVRRITLEQMDMGGMPVLNHNGKMWGDPVEDFVALGSTEVWEVVNTLPDSHPFHVHLVDFQVLDRRPYDVAEFLKSGQLRYSGEPQAPAENEMGWKDVVRVPPGHVTRIILKFGPYLGHYIYHCHILEHEDMDMMRPFEVVTPVSKYLRQ